VLVPPQLGVVVAEGVFDVGALGGVGPQPDAQVVGGLSPGVEGDAGGDAGGGRDGLASRRGLVWVRIVGAWMDPSFWFSPVVRERSWPTMRAK
jgi:hypothetical protein